MVNTFFWEDGGYRWLQVVVVSDSSFVLFVVMNPQNLGVAIRLFSVEAVYENVIV